MAIFNTLTAAYTAIQAGTAVDGDTVTETNQVIRKDAKGYALTGKRELHDPVTLSVESIQENRI